MTVKIGAIYYTVMSDDDGTATMEEFHVRTIRGGRIYAIWKNNVTWGKRSKTIGDFGWLDPLPDWSRDSWRVGSQPLGKFTTRKQAVKDAFKKYTTDDFDTPEQFEKLKRSLARLKT